MTNRDKAIDILSELSLQGISNEQIIEHILTNVLSGDKALEVMKDCADEFNVNYED